MGALLEKIDGGKISRRSFVATSALAAATAALAGATPAQSYAAESELAETGNRIDSELAEGATGEWRSAACWMNCGGKCLNLAYVQDGMVLRQKTDDTHEDSYDYPQMRGCLKGRALRTTVFGEDRLKYPMKRKNWQPGGGENAHGELRGNDEWERISWEEALQYVADEMIRVKEQYGCESILAPVYGGWYLPDCRFREVLAEFGGHTGVYDTASFGSFLSCSAPFGMNFVDITQKPERGGMNDRYDMLKADTIVLYGCNPAWAAMGVPVYNLMRAKEQGIPFVVVGPDYNVSAGLYDARWIPVRPGTDTAFLLGVAYSMLQQDEEKNLIDWDFLHNCCVGFDEESMPEGAPADQNFRAYLEGNLDGVAKTPEWASKICGTPVEDIEWYAELMSKDNNLWIMTALAPGRCNNSENFPQIFHTVAYMGAHVGREGNSAGVGFIGWATNNGPYLVDNGDSKDKYTDTTLQSFYASQLWQDVLDHKWHVSGSIKYHTDEGDLEATTEVRDWYPGIFFNLFRNAMQTMPGEDLALEAIKEFDMVVSLKSWPDLTCKYSDIILPITTLWERQSLYFYQTQRNREFAVFPSKIIEPLYECKSDWQIGYELAPLLGLDPDQVYPLTDEQAYFNKITTTQVLDADGVTYKPMVSVSQEDIDNWEAKYGPVPADAQTREEGEISLTDLLALGMFQVERHEGDNYDFISYKEFVDDPEGHPLETASGKFEIYCEAKQSAVADFGFSTVEPYPDYQVPLNGYEASFSDYEGGVRGEYPIQIFNPHYAKRAHTPYDNVPITREAFASPAFINPQDAAERGIENGDVIRIFNRFGGSVLRQAAVTNRLMPGVMSLPHGGWTEINEDGDDVGGGDSLLIAPEHTGAAVTAYNTNLVNFEKYTGTAFLADAERPLVVLSVEGEEA